MKIPRWLFVLGWLVSLVGAAAATTFYFEHRAGILGRLGLTPKIGILATNLYDIRLQAVDLPTEGRYGAIDPLGAGILYASRAGTLTFFDSARTPHRLRHRVPIDIAAFADDPQNADVVDADHFAVKDLLVLPAPGGVRVVASFNAWFPERDCYLLRVAALELPMDSLLSGADTPAAWRTLYDTTPCLPLAELGNGRRRPTLGAGGRLASLDADHLLLTVGAFGSEDATSDDRGVDARPADASYSRTIAIRVDGGGGRVFTTGHRNPQGLVVASDGRIWSTEHAAKGGDELNQLVDGRDYGYPHVSYGTQYGMFVWPPSPDAPGRHEGYAKPIYAWVPSIGVSQLIEVRGPAFRTWRGDLLVSSLVARTLHRVRIEEGRVVIVEPIALGYRLRDITEDAAGAIVLLVEDQFLLYLTPINGNTPDPSLSAEERGQVVAGTCRGCHAFTADGANGLGPNLHGVLRRAVAAAPGFTFSPALRAAGGRWDESRLRAFLAAPGTFAPGTTMALPAPLSAAQIDDLVAYLRTLR